jgi:hypothetical protein
MLVNVREEVPFHFCPQCDAPIVYFSKICDTSDWGADDPDSRPFTKTPEE